MNTENNYANTPVEGFGSKILSKMGWFKGRGIGKRSNGEVPLHLNISGREERNGLGSEKKQIIKKKSEISIGSSVEVFLGKHTGITGTVIDISDDNAIIEIHKNNTKLKVPLLSIKIGTKQMNEVTIIATTKELKWVLPGLKIRIRNKRVHNGELYNCKAIIEDVQNSFKFTIRANNKIIDDLTEKDIETLIPPLGENAKIVKGKNKGDICRLLTRNKKKIS